MSPTSRRSYRPSIECLEERTVPYALSGSSWANHTLSASFVPDGTSSEGYTSSLFSTLNSVAPTATWQREFARALQTWADVADLNFYFLDDDGTASGASGQAQGDARFGDIRLGAHPLNGYVAYAYYPNSSYTIGGDVFLNPSYTFNVGTHVDLYSVFLHELGHSLGLGHSTSGTVMNSMLTGVYTGLSADDVAGIQAIYGARSQDSFDQAGANNTLSSASLVSLGSGGSATFLADLSSISDVDYYRVVAPSNGDGTVTVTLDARRVSLLGGRVAVYDGGGNLLGSATAGSAYGTVVPLQLTGLTAGQSYHVMADGAGSDEFGMGAYRLTVTFGTATQPPPSPPPPTPPPPPSLSPDAYEVNDTTASARNLGRTNGFNVTSLTVHNSTDVDFFSFVARSSATFRVSALFTGASGNLNLIVYDASGRVVASGSSLGDNEVVTVGLVSGRQYYVKVFGAAGAVNSYSLSLEKVGVSGGGKGGKGVGGGVELGHGTYAAGYEPVDLLRFTSTPGAAHADLDGSLLVKILEKVSEGRSHRR